MTNDSTSILNRYTWIHGRCRMTELNFQFECYFLFCYCMKLYQLLGYTDLSCKMVCYSWKVGCLMLLLWPTLLWFTWRDWGKSQSTQTGLLVFDQDLTGLVPKYDIWPLCLASGFEYGLYHMEELVMCVIACVHLMEMFFWYFSQDILVFLTGQEEIEAMARSIRLIVKVRPAKRDIWS